MAASQQSKGRWFDSGSSDIFAFFFGWVDAGYLLELCLIASNSNCENRSDVYFNKEATSL